MILVLGATGPTGSGTASRLVARGAVVRAVSRDPKKAAQLPALAGVELLPGDISAPDSLAGVFDGVTKVYLVPPTAVGWDHMQSAIISMAALAGVKHIVKLSAMGAGPDQPSMSLRYHWQGEQDIEASGMAFTHIRANSFFQNTLFDLASLQNEGCFYSCVGDAKFAKIDTRDIAEVVEKALTEDGHGGKTYELTGPEALTYSDMAAQLSMAVKSRFEYRDLSPDKYTISLSESGVPGWLAAEFSDIYGRGFYHEGGGSRVTQTVQQLLDRPPRTFAAFAADHAKMFQRQ